VIRYKIDKHNSALKKHLDNVDYEKCNKCGETMRYSPDAMYEHNRLRHGKVTEEFHSANGFHGIINHPTRFLVGEAGRERVDITPIKSKRKSNYNWFDYDFTKDIGFNWD
jgi:hypothetical protein